MSDDRYWPLERAAELLDVPLSNIRLMATRGDVKAEQRDGQWLVAQSSIDELNALKARQTGRSEAPAGSGRSPRCQGDLPGLSGGALAVFAKERRQGAQLLRLLPPSRGALVLGRCGFEFLSGLVPLPLRLADEER